MIDAYCRPTPNGWKVTIMLEECGLDYSIKPVEIGGGGQFKPGFVRIGPNGRMPAIVDHDPPGGGAPGTALQPDQRQGAKSRGTSSRSRLPRHWPGLPSADRA